MQRNSAEIFAEIAELEKYNPRGSRDSGLWFSEHDWDNEIIPCINEMKQKYNIPFDAIPEPEEPVTDELVENKIIFFENPNELKKIDLDFHKIEITKQPTDLQIKMSKSVKALNELVSYSPFSQGSELHFAPQDWRDYLYDEAVSFQRQTKSKNPVEFLPEVWDLIKDFVICRTKEQLVNSIVPILRSVETKSKFPLGPRGYGVVYQNGVALAPCIEKKLPTGSVLYCASTGQVYRIEKGCFRLLQVGERESVYFGEREPEVRGKPIIKERLGIQGGRHSLRYEKINIASSYEWKREFCPYTRKLYKDGKNHMGRVELFYKVNPNRSWIVKVHFEAVPFEEEEEEEAEYDD